MHQTLASSDVFDVCAFDGNFDLGFDALDYADTPQASPNSVFLRGIIKELIKDQHSDEPTSPELSTESPKQQTNDSLPRHRRNSHVRAEKRRRKRIYEQLRTLQDCVPALRPSRNAKKLSELECLEEAGKHIKEKKHHSEARLAEIDHLRKEKEALNMELNQFQAALPTSGLKKRAKPPQSIAERYGEYRNKQFSDNWKHGLFDRIVGSDLAETYIQHTGSSTPPTVYLQSLMKWTESCLSLSHLRPVVISGLRDLGTNTSILTNPGQVKQELASGMQQTPSLPSATATTSSTTIDTAVPTSVAKTTVLATSPNVANTTVLATSPNVVTATTPNTAVNTTENTTFTASSTTATAAPTIAAPYICFATAANTTAVRVAAIAPSKAAAS